MLLKKWLILSRRHRKRLISLVKFLIGILILGGFISLLIFFYKSDYFIVKKITCQQDGFPCKDNIFLDYIKGKNIFLVNNRILNNKVKDYFTFIEDVNIIKKLPDEIGIIIKTRKSNAGITKDRKAWFLIDESGFIYKKVFTLDKGISEIVIDKDRKSVV